MCARRLVVKRAGSRGRASLPFEGGWAPGLRGSGSGSSSRRGGRGTRGPGAGTGSAALLLSARGMVAGASVRFRCVDGVDVGPDEYPLNTSVAKLKALLVEQLKGRGTVGLQTVFARCSARPVCRRAGREARAARHVRRGHQRRCLPHSAAACTGARLLRGGQRRGARRD